MSRVVSISAMAAALLLGAGVLVVSRIDHAPTDSAGEAERRPAFAMLPPPSAGPLPNSGGFSAHARPGRIGVAQSPITVRYTFDGGVDKPIADTSGGHELRPLGQNGGTLHLVRQGAGLAVAFPARCAFARESDCPRAILEGQRDDALNPGRRAVQYGASIRLTHADLGDGANVVQKGYSVGGVSQFKMQVDHRKGHPSCVIASRSRIYRAEPTLDVADGSWHDVACARTPGRLAIIVDGVEREAVRVPAELSIANAEPLRVGGKGANKGNDQYAGQIDNVFVEIS